MNFEKKIKTSGSAQAEKQDGNNTILLCFYVAL
jgi:hypothetical protein